GILQFRPSFLRNYANTPEGFWVRWHQGSGQEGFGHWGLSLLGLAGHRRRGQAHLLPLFLSPLFPSLGAWLEFGGSWRFLDFMELALFQRLNLGVLQRRRLVGAARSRGFRGKKAIRRNPSAFLAFRFRSPGNFRSNPSKLKFLLLILFSMN